MTASLTSLALTLKEQAVLAVIHRVRWTPNDTEQFNLQKNGQLRVRKGRSPSYGATQELALRIIAGEFGTDNSIPEIIEQEKARRERLEMPLVAFSDQSLKNTLWRLRNDKQGKQRRRAA